MRLIDADAFKRDVKNRCVLSPLDAPWPLAYGDTDLFEIIDATPTAEPIKHGRWETTRPDAPMFGFYYCSECGRRRTSPQDNYCPNCGAKMIDEVENG